MRVDDDNGADDDDDDEGCERDFFCCCLLLTSLFRIHFSRDVFVLLFRATQVRLTFPLFLLISGQLDSASHTLKYNKHTQTDCKPDLHDSFSTSTRDGRV